MQVETLIHARWVIPVQPTGKILEHHSIAIDEGRIVAILPTNDAKTQINASVECEYSQHVVLPGLINAHGHAAMTLMRGFADDMPLMNWLNDHIWPAEKEWVSQEFVYDGTLMACAEMIRGGITCFADMYFFPDSTARAAEHASIRAVIGLIMIDFPSAWAENASDYLHKGIQLHDLLRSNPLISTMFAPHAPYTVSDAPLQQIATYAEELDIPIQIHLHETADEIEQSLKQLQLRPLERLQKLGLLNPRLVGVHMTQVTEVDIQNYAQAGAHIIHCPESNLKLASGFCPVAKLQAAGINIALGTDGAASNNDLDLFGEMRTTALLGKAVANDASVIKAEDVLSMATINAARALGLDEEIGSIEINKAADLIAVDLAPLETQPVYNPVSQLIYAAQRSQVTDVWIAGKHVLKEQQLTTLDARAISKKARHWHDRLAASDNF